jgi:ATP-dependent DNA helicase 2 subunit 2
MKEAVVLILDANASMAANYDEGNSRFECAKKVARDMICNLMIQSKTNEVGVVVLKSPQTQHHFYEPDDDEDLNNEEDGEVPFPNIVEFGGDGEATMVSRPTPNILRKIQSLQVSSNSSSLRGDFCDGIIVATDSLYRKTNKKKYQRRIVLITDAEHKVEVDPQQLSVVLDGLCDLQCTLEVIGLDFEKHATFEKPIVKSEPSVAVKKEETNTDEDSETDVGSDTDDDGDGADDTEEGDDVQLIKSQNESLLISLTQKTGGYVMAARELESIFETLLGKRKPKSMRRKVEFQIAPGLTIEARFSLLLSKASIPSLKKRVAAADLPQSKRGEDDDDNNQEEQTNKQEELLFFKRIEGHFDAEHEELEITDRGQAYRYGSDLVPMSGYDMGGLATLSAVKLKILGYLPYSKVPKALCIGPPYVLSGADSRKACAAISATARALERKKHVAIATFVQTKNTDPSLVGIFPFIDQLSSTASPQQPIHLVVLKLPFRGDVAALSKPSFGAHEKSKEKICDDLIDALRLNEDQLDYTEIGNPQIRSYWKTVIERVMDPKHEIVTARNESNDDMAIPTENLKRAKPALEAFYDSFPLPSAVINDKKKKK